MAHTAVLEYVVNNGQRRHAHGFVLTLAALLNQRQPARVKGLCITIAQRLIVLGIDVATYPAALIAHLFAQAYPARESQHKQRAANGFTRSFVRMCRGQLCL